MKQIALVLSCIAIALVIVACTETSTPTNTSTPTAAASPPVSTAPGAEFASARANFAQHCVPCHGENAEGGVVTIKDRRIEVPSLKARHAVEHSDEELKNQITNGEQAMPSFKEKLSEAEITELVQFVRKEFQGK